MSSPGAGDRVVIDPEELRRVATKMRGGAEMLSSAGRHLATRPQPGLPGELATHVARALQSANRELQELSLELVQTAGELAARATQAELGEVDPVAWLIPGLHGFGSLFELRGGATLSPSGRFIDVPQGPAWAEVALRDMSPLQPALEDIDLDDFADALQGSEQGLTEMPPAGAMLDLYAELGGEPASDTGATRGALGIAFDDADLGPTGLGLMGCLLSGSADVSADDAGAGA